MPTRHAQILINIGRKGVLIDEKLAPYIVALNNEDFITTDSCQGEEERTSGYITFEGKLTNRQRCRIEEIMGLPAFLPTLVGEDDGKHKHVDIWPDFPYWELWVEKDQMTWVLRFHPSHIFER